MRQARETVIFILAALLGCLLFTGCADKLANSSSPVETAAEIPEASTASATPSAVNFAHAYGVFLGLNPEDMERLSGYKLVVIDAAYYTAEQIAQMHDVGQTVYTYLNIGSVESFRDYYDKYEPLTLGVYEDWPDERWVDVSRQEWQNFIVNTLAASMTEKGVDGFFLDNADVYYQYPRQDIYDGLLSIVSDLGQYGLPLVINGGDTFVRALINSGESDRISGVNQESVFTSIDFDNSTFGTQDAENHAYYLEYLSVCRNAGLDVYLLEYAAEPAAVETKVSAYCEENGFQYYISDDGTGRLKTQQHDTIARDTAAAAMILLNHRPRFLQPRHKTYVFGGRASTHPRKKSDRMMRGLMVLYKGGIEQAKSGCAMPLDSGKGVNL